ncbi:uridine 5'-monophosphate synthase [Bombus pyrosoma]|uniref:uridine 5'-monophosphate synthase n=1 Tax=Bombus pyrosoma TaxID=396416 RepID=UPI001CB9A43C|nr:uridine 5'-monophosphate synthase [Bombus pyrosoma]XP_043599902.1 uridine 5'-monophosphate synthase [Bombus pyrosoma]XP_043599903.1 uridine 5'-monophosphate synthase [Bombus pyrosoma]XP_043599904.1 uridine 5'-monophosphate synthase [Bombus pyrosoma]
MDSGLEDLALTLFDIGAFKFGEFVTKVGLKTPIYFDLRVLVSHPKVMICVARMLLPFVEECPNVAQICGVPYTALPLATLISIYSNVPMLIKRKEKKTYGTKKIIEGNFEPGDSCVIIEDVVTSGSSILETVDILRGEGLKVTEAFVVIDREQNGKKNIESHGIVMRSLYTTTKLMTYLLKANKIAPKIVKDVTDYLLTSQAPIISQDIRLKTPFHIRANRCKNAIGSKLFNLMESKQSTICLAADLTKADAVIELADLVGPHIVLLKTHVDILEDFSDNFIKRLKELAKKHDFLLMEDRKFADIGNTVCLQYEKGIYKIAQWADVVTVHVIAGQSIIDTFKNSFKNISEPRGLFVVAEMSSKGALTTIDQYVQNAISMAESSDMVIGVVCQSDIFESPGLIQLTPGVKILKSSDDLGQQYNTPESVVNSGADLAVVGRGITEAEDKLAATLKYKEELWTAYIKRITDQ